jgi:hypothetical protein
MPSHFHNFRFAVGNSPGRQASGCLVSHYQKLPVHELPVHGYLMHECAGRLHGEGGFRGFQVSRASTLQSRAAADGILSRR